MSIINKINLYRDNSPLVPSILPYSGDTYGGNPNKLVFSIQNDSSQPILNANKFSLFLWRRIPPSSISGGGMRFPPFCSLNYCISGENML